MSEAMVVLERVTHVTPGGLSLWDMATRRRVSDGIVVTYPSSGSSDGSGKRQAITSPSGIFILQGLPGLLDSEQAEGDDAFWSSPPASGTFEIQVADPLGRFIGCSFDASLPHRGLLEAICGPPDSPPIGSPPDPEMLVVPLFSAPGRATPPGMAVLRTELWNHQSMTPAAWALVRVTPPGQPPAFGLADERGRATVFFPIPEPSGLDASPPALPSRPLSQQAWQHIQLEVFFSQLSAPVVGGLPVAQGLDLCAILTQLTQPPASLVASESPFIPLTEVTLEFGRELVVRSAPHEPQLFVIPSVSPPSP